MGRITRNERVADTKASDELIAGWEIQDSWRNHCYWGPNGCKEGAPVAQTEWFWSLLEFGVKIKRQAPYYGLTVLLPTMVTCVLALAVFWIDDHRVAITLTVLNIILQGVFGWDLIQQLPPGNNSMPKIVIFSGVNLSLAAVSLVVHVLIQYFNTIVPEDIELPFQITTITERLRELRLFSTKGLSFDPQLLLNGDSDNDTEEDGQSSPQPTNEATLIDMGPVNSTQNSHHSLEEANTVVPPFTSCVERSSSSTP
uniref:Neur_chan_memb domain-containing protein n=1 Tax=Steinernema glaseri TaxID=37863 RepID=A0A1I7ZSK5_9BILA